jgi:hypothetical protein
MQYQLRFTHPLQLYVSVTQKALLDSIPPELQGGYMRDFGLADEAFCSGQLEAPSQGREAHWQNWCTYVQPLGVDPYPQHMPFQTQVRCLTGFAAQTRTGYYGRGGQVQSSTVTGAITAIGQTIALACSDNPTKVIGLDEFLPAIQVMIDDYAKADPPTKKMLPVESDVPELLVELGYGKYGLIKVQAVGDLALIAFYYSLRIGEYTVKRKHNDSKQTVQFKLEDVTFFKKNKWGKLVCLPKNALYSLLATADSATF